MAESLNMKCGNRRDIQKVLEKKYPRLLPIYQAGFDQGYWNEVNEEVKRLSGEFKIPLKGFYRH